MGKNYFSFDGESNGLHGQSFAIGAIVYDENGNEIDKLAVRCPIEDEVNPWVAENVLPQIESIPQTHESYGDMLKAFSEFWLKYKDRADALVHMGQIVEAKIIKDAHELGYLGDWDCPYGWIDVYALKEIGDSVDTYAKNNNIEISQRAGGTHNPLYDCEVAAKAYFHWQQEREKEKNELSWIKEQFAKITDPDKNNRDVELEPIKQTTIPVQAGKER